MFRPLSVESSEVERLLDLADKPQVYHFPRKDLQKRFVELLKQVFRDVPDDLPVPDFANIIKNNKFAEDLPKLFYKAALDVAMRYSYDSKATAQSQAETRGFVLLQQVSSLSKPAQPVVGTAGVLDSHQNAQVSDTEPQVSASAINECVRIFDKIQQLYQEMDHKMGHTDNPDMSILNEVNRAFMSFFEKGRNILSDIFQHPRVVERMTAESDDNIL